MVEFEEIVIYTTIFLLILFIVTFFQGERIDMINFMLLLIQISFGLIIAINFLLLSHYYILPY